MKQLTMCWLALGLFLLTVLTTSASAQPLVGRIDLTSEQSPVSGLLSLDSCSLRDSEPIVIRDEDEVWIVDGRECHCDPGDLNRLSIQKFCAGSWEMSTLDSLLTAHVTDPTRATLVYVHGDRTDDYWATHRGLQFYQNVFSTAVEPRAGVRFIIWAWRSEKRQVRPSKDYSTKSSRAQLVGKALAQFLNQFADQRVVLVGYSLGCQAYLVALEELAACGNNSCCSTSDGYRVCLLAPALDGNYVSELYCRGADARNIARTDIFDNSSDRALRYARFLGSRSAPGGGISIQTLALKGSLPLSNISLIDLSEGVGKKHGIVHYSANPVFGFRLREMVNETSEQIVQAEPGKK